MCGSTNVDDFDDIFILGGGVVSLLRGLPHVT